MRLRPSLLALLMLLFCGGLLVLADFLRGSRDFSDAALLRRLPANDGVCLYLDVQSLRASGLLEVIAGQRTEEEPDYQDFVKKSNFDYREDLDKLVGYVGPDFNLFLSAAASWPAISRYMKDNSAVCANGVCSINGRQGRFISAMPLARDVVAVGVGRYRTVVYAAHNEREGGNPALPAAPFWVELSRQYLKNPAALPEGTRSFFTAVEGANSLFISVAPVGASLEAQMHASFSAPAEAAQRKVRLDQATEMLRTFFERDGKQPGESAIASMLVSGKFETKEGKLIGRWPLPRTLLDQLLLR